MVRNELASSPMLCGKVYISSGYLELLMLIQGYSAEVYVKHWLSMLVLGLGNGPAY